MEKVSGIVTCFNRENEIEQCLQSVRWVDELIVVDSFSTDRTVERVKPYADKFFQREYSSPGDQKNWAITRASYSWIVVIDSDEVMPEELRDEIRRTLRSPTFDCYLVYRRGIFLGKKMKHGGWNRDTNYLLFSGNRYRYTDEVHERLVPETDYGIFENRLIHYTHRSINEFMVKSNRYATMGALKYYRKGRRGMVTDMIFHPLFNFCKNYIFRLGCLDGARGLISAVLSSCYVAQKYAKLWELRNQKTEK